MEMIKIYYAASLDLVGEMAHHALNEQQIFGKDEAFSGSYLLLNNRLSLALGILDVLTLRDV